MNNALNRCSVELEQLSVVGLGNASGCLLNLLAVVVRPPLHFSRIGVHLHPSGSNAWRSVLLLWCSMHAISSCELWRRISRIHNKLLLSYLHERLHMHLLTRAGRTRFVVFLSTIILVLVIRRRFKEITVRAHPAKSLPVLFNGVGRILNEDSWICWRSHHSIFWVFKVVFFHEAHVASHVHSSKRMHSCPTYGSRILSVLSHRCVVIGLNVTLLARTCLALHDLLTSLTHCCNWALKGFARRSAFRVVMTLIFSF